MNIKIELPATFDATSRGVAVTIPLGELSAEIIAELVMHGLQQKVADAASAAKSVADESGNPVEDVTRELMQKAADGLLAGEWTRRTGGGGVSEEVRIARIVTRKLVKDKFGSKSPEWATFTGLELSEQNEKLDAWFAANEKVLAPERDAEMARRAEAEAAKRAAKKEVTFSL